MNPYASIAILCAMSAVVVGGMVSLNRVLGPRATHSVKGDAFECGNPPTGSAWGRFPIKFYMPAILFLLFDIEIVFLYPWAILFRDLGMFGFVEMLLFLGVLGIGLL